MIVKKVTNPRKSAGKGTRAAGLAQYIRARQAAGAKCVHAGARGFLSTTPAGQILEMTELAEAAVRSPDPLNHYILSWSAGERPEARQVEAAVDLFMEELGLTGHQVIFALHADTDNPHLHLVVNRVHPVTERCVEINNGFDLEAAHRGVARIAAVQGWRMQRNALYRMGPEGALVENDGRLRLGPQPTQRVRDRENRTGIRSAQRRAIAQAAPVIAKARSWAEVHSGLAARGMHYEKAGGGARIRVGTIAVKASTVARTASLSRLAQRLGPFEPPAGVAIPAPSTTQDTPFAGAAEVIAAAPRWADVHTGLAAIGMRYERVGSGAQLMGPHGSEKASVIARAASLGQLRKRLGPFVAAATIAPAALGGDAPLLSPPALEPPAPGPLEPLVPGIPGWDDYARAHQHQQAARRARAALRQRQDAEQEALRCRQQAETDRRRREARFAHWIFRLVWRQTLAAQHTAQRMQLRRRQHQQWAALRRDCAPVPSFEDWLHRHRGADAAQAWRYRNGAWRTLAGDRFAPPEPVPLVGFTAQRTPGGGVDYLRLGETEPVFRDDGWQVQVRDWTRPDTVRAALERAQSKWGHARVSGCRRFQTLCVELAVDPGFTLANPDLREQVEAHCAARAREEQAKAERVAQESRACPTEPVCEPSPRPSGMDGPSG